MVGITDTQITPYALELKASNLEAGMLTSLANLFGPMAQLLGSRLIERFNRRQIIVWAVVGQTISCFAFSILGYIFLSHDKQLYLVALFILNYTLYNLTSALASPAWFSMMGDIVPENIRGRYFAWRNRTNGAASVGAMILSASILYWLAQYEIIYGFIIIFGLAGIARSISTYLLSKHYCEDIKLEKDYYFPFWKFIKEIPRYNFNRFALYVSFFRLGVNIAGPFFAVYMWKQLAYNPIWFTAVNISAGIFSLLALPAWGYFADRYGNRELIRVSSIILIFVPLFWMFSANPIYLILVPQLISGSGWAAFNLASSNFIYDSVEPSRRGLMVAYFNLLSGFGIFLGATLGGVLSQYIKIGLMNVFFVIFVVSSLATLAVTITMLRTIKEVRVYEHEAQKNPLMYLKEIRPLYSNLEFGAYPVKKFHQLKSNLKSYRRQRITYY